MRSCIEIHTGIIASVIGGHVITENAIVKAHCSEDAAMADLNSTFRILEGMNFMEIYTLKLPNRNPVHVYAKGHFPFHVSLSVEKEYLMIVLGPKDGIH